MTAQLPFFVYGTLRPGNQTNYAIIENVVTKVQLAVLPGYRLYLSTLPYAGPGEKLRGKALRGDLLTIEEDSYGQALEVLDGLENYNPPNYSSYIRAALGVAYFDGTEVKFTTAWVYLGGPDFSYHPRFIVETGDYLRRIQPARRDKAS